MVYAYFAKIKANIEGWKWSNQTQAAWDEQSDGIDKQTLIKTFMESEKFKSNEVRWTFTFTLKKLI